MEKEYEGFIEYVEFCLDCGFANDITDYEYSLYLDLIKGGE